MDCLCFVKRLLFTEPFFKLCDGELAEWSNAAVLKTVGPQGPVGSNPTLSATPKQTTACESYFVFLDAS